MVGDCRALNTYTVPDRCPIPRIQEALIQLSKAKYIKSMDALKGFNQKCLTPKAKKLLRIITYCGIYEYLRIPFGIKNAPSHYQRMMNTIFSKELSEGWLIIYIDDIIICYDSLYVTATSNDPPPWVLQQSSLEPSWGQFATPYLL
ncbi:hypothetical protein O181_123256 [Austropuccinia psidii MF-1]|uniref:Reverse transcriptase domain-containing protein n=1 Tax=Austropuccinia psidii MF-1 TaxID=1389203 RepID=A0A9Q3KNW1_9BASI|nr:hypothetical protein [Austropuccinia psidii MF-1]